MATNRGETLLEEGVVLSVHSGNARIHLVAGDHCDGCPASSVCKPSDGERRVLDVDDPVGTTPGDRVRVMVTGGAVLRASFLVYGLPLILLVAGVAIGSKIWPSGTARGDLLSFGLGAGLAALAAPLAAWWARQHGRDQALSPRIVEILTK